MRRDLGANERASHNERLPSHIARRLEITKQDVNGSWCIPRDRTPVLAWPIDYPAAAAAVAKLLHSSGAGWTGRPATATQGSLTGDDNGGAHSPTLGGGEECGRQAIPCRELRRAATRWDVEWLD